MKETAIIFYRLLLYGLAITILVLLFPGEGKFRYEFQKGRPWLHESLIAPFDFAIYKLDEEVNHEQDSILKAFRPYFRYDNKVFDEKKALLNTYLNRHFKQYIEKNEERTALLLPHQKKIIDSVLQYFAIIYEVGIIEVPDIVQSRYIMKIKDNYAEEAELADFYIPKKAYRYIQSRITRMNANLGNNAGIAATEMFKRMGLENFIAPNMFYDEISSKNARTELIQRVSLTKGLIQRGERIVHSGDVVNNETYRILSSLKREYEQRIDQMGNYYLIIAGRVFLISLLLIILSFYIKHYRRELNKGKVNTFFILLVMVVISAIASFFLNYQIANIYIIPFVILPIVINAFYDVRMALVVHTITTIIIGFWAPNSFEFVLFNITAGIVVLLRLSRHFNRNRIFFTAIFVILTYSLLYVAKFIIQEGDWKSIDLNQFSYFAVNGLLILTSIPIVYFLERSFGFISETTLLEVSDTNQPLLRKLAEIAPGTFQHSLQVANLAEAAIRLIGGNHRLVRAGALYHDIGKMKNPTFFIENQLNVPNPHDSLEEESSAKIIIEHIEEGVRLAEKNGLHPSIIDFIRSHHGDTRVMYFYKMFLSRHPEQDPSIASFTYPGPKPQTKETAVVMLADSIEAASRSLESYSSQSISILVESIVGTYMEKGQLNETDMTLRDITRVKQVFKDRLKNVYHLRISYPKDN